MNAAVQDIPRVDACPPALRDLKAWLCWRLVQKPGEKKPRKLPFFAGGGAREHAHGSLEDRAKLVTFAEARTAAITRGHHGVGFCPLRETPKPLLSAERTLAWPLTSFPTGSPHSSTR